MPLQYIFAQLILKRKNQKAILLSFQAVSIFFTTLSNLLCYKLHLLEQLIASVKSQKEHFYAPIL